jgi:hypothetical protein
MFAIIIFMSKFETLEQLARWLDQDKKHPDDAEFVRRIARQGGQINHKVTRLAEGGIGDGRAQLANAALANTGEDNHFGSRNSKKFLKQSVGRFLSRFRRG